MNPLGRRGQRNLVTIIFVMPDNNLTMYYKLDLFEIVPQGAVPPKDVPNRLIMRWLTPVFSYCLNNFFYVHKIVTRAELKLGTETIMRLMSGQ